MEAEIKHAVDFQEKTGLDLFVHGEPERNDMVQYFGEQLNGFIFTQVSSQDTQCIMKLIKASAWMGPVVRLAIRAPAYCRLRCLSHSAHDRPVVRLCSEPDQQAYEGHAHRPGHRESPR